MDKSNLTKITCNVLTCGYNKDLCCTAKQIYVGTEYASDITDTVCASYYHFTESNLKD